MKIYIFDDVEHLTEHYHSEGGLAIVAPDKKGAMALIEADKSMTVTDEEWKAVVAYPLKGEHDIKMYVFPDAGCC